MSLWVVIVIWVVLSCLTSPIIGAVILGRVRDERGYPKAGRADRRFRQVGNEPSAVIRLESAKPPAMALRFSKRFAAPSSIQSRGSRRLLH